MGPLWIARAHCNWNPLVSYAVRLARNAMQVTFCQPLFDGTFVLPCSRQAPSTEPCASGSSHSKSFDQLKCGPYLGSGDTADSVSVTSAGSSSSDVEEINISFIPESPDGQEKKVQDSDSLDPARARGGRRQVRPISRETLALGHCGWEKGSITNPKGVPMIQNA